MTFWRKHSVGIRGTHPCHCSGGGVVTISQKTCGRCGVHTTKHCTHERGSSHLCAVCLGEHEKEEGTRCDACGLSTTGPGSGTLVTCLGKCGRMVHGKGECMGEWRKGDRPGRIGCGRGGCEEVHTTEKTLCGTCNRPAWATEGGFQCEHCGKNWCEIHVPTRHKQEDCRNPKATKKLRQGRNKHNV